MYMNTKMAKFCSYMYFTGWTRFYTAPHYHICSSEAESSLQTSPGTHDNVSILSIGILLECLAHYYYLWGFYLFKSETFLQFALQKTASVS